MSLVDTIISNLPTVAPPKQKRLGFKEKIKWTLITLVLFFILGLVPLYGLGANALQNFEFLSIILGASFGSIISLGIGPIVTASIVLTLLNGSGLIKLDQQTPEGKKRFQGIQKLLAFAFIIIEAIIYVQLGGLTPVLGIPASVLIFQLIVGGILIMFMDEVINGWGLGQGISLFIAAGVAQSIFVRALNPLRSDFSPDAYSIGAIPKLFQALAENEIGIAGLQLASIIGTIVVFAMVVYVQGMKVEIPLSFGRMRGHGVRWPLNFMYTSNIPVILIAALLANIQLLSTLVNNPTMLEIVSWLTAPGGVQGGGLVGIIINQGTFLIDWTFYAKAIVYTIFFMAGSALFSWFWVQTSGLDARNQAKQMLSSGLQIPGFRKDQRVLERLLERYIGPLTIMGGLAVGLLAALADILGALTSGTGLLLTVMIIYRLYEEIAKQHMMDINPGMRKFMGG